MASGGAFLLPEDFKPSDSDVICGWAKKYYHHAGNRKLRALVNHYAPFYMQTGNKIAKGPIISAILAKVHEGSNSTPGRVVRQDQVTNRWFDIGLDKSKDKIGHALRKSTRTSRTRTKAKSIQLMRQKCFEKTSVIKSRPPLSEIKHDTTNAPTFSSTFHPTVSFEEDENVSSTRGPHGRDDTQHHHQQQEYPHFLPMGVYNEYAQHYYARLTQTSQYTFYNRPDDHNDSCATTLIHPPHFVQQQPSSCHPQYGSYSYYYPVQEHPSKGSQTIADTTTPSICSTESRQKISEEERDHSSRGKGGQFQQQTPFSDLLFYRADMLPTPKLDTARRLDYSPNHCIPSRWSASR